MDWRKRTKAKHWNSIQKSLRSATNLSKSSKCQLFISLQMHHIKQWGIAIQIAEFRCLPNFPCQQANRSTTVFDITQWMPNRVNTIDHKSKSIEQWMKRWSIDSPFILHIQHQSKIKICRFLRLSIVKIFPKAVVHTKKATLEETLDFQTVFQGKDWSKLLVSTW